MNLEKMGISELEERYFNEFRNNSDPMKFMFCLFKLALREERQKWEANQVEQAPLLSIQQLADKFKVTKATVHNWIKRGIITGKKMGKGRFFDESEVRDSVDRFKGYIVPPRF